MKLTKDYIAEHIKRTKYFLWSLYIVQNYKRIHLMSYYADDINENDSDEAKTEKSINRLFAVLNEMPREAVLSIDLKNSKNANGNGIVGPIEFINYTKDEQQEQPQQQNFNGFGFINPPQGWVSESVLNGRLEELRVENQKTINDLIFKQREKDFEEKMHRERAEIAEIRRELAAEKKKYDSNTGAAAETLIIAMKKILGELFPGFVPQSQPAQPALAGTPDPEPAPADGKYKAVEKLASMLYEDKRVSEVEVENLSKSISEHLQNINKPHQQAAGTEEGGKNG